MRRIIRADTPLVREEWDREKVRDFFVKQGETFKAEWVMELPEDETISMYRTGEWLDLCRGPHLALDRQARSRCLQADPGLGRLLARRPEQPAALPHLRHGLAQPEAARGASGPARGGGQARPSQDRPGDGPVPPPGRGARLGLLAPQRLYHLAPARGLSAPPARRGRLSGGEDAAAHGRAPVGAVRPLGQISREHVRRPRRDSEHRGGRTGPLRRGRSDGAEADELPGPRPDLPPGHQILSRPADPARRIRLLPPQRAARRAARHPAGPPVHPGRRPHLLPRGPDRRGDAAVLRPARLDLPRSRLRRLRDQARAPAGEAPRLRRDLGQGRAGSARRRPAGRPGHARISMGGAAGRRRLLFAQARIPPDRRDRPDLAVRHAAARLRHAGAARRLLHRRGRREAHARSCSTAPSSARSSASSAY